MTLGGGYTAILPFFVFEMGYGLSRRVDVAFRYETVSGLFHYPQLAVRWAFADVGAWTLGARLGVNYSLFAVKSDQTDLTSTVYLSGELIASRPVSRGGGLPRSRSAATSTSGSTASSTARSTRRARTGTTRRSSASARGRRPRTI